MSAREAVAKAIYEATYPGWSWEQLPAVHLEEWGRIADAAMAVMPVVDETRLAAVGLAGASDVLPDGRVDHRGHLRDDQGGHGWVCLDCTDDDAGEPWIDWTVPYDAEGRPISEDWRTMRYADLLVLCGMVAPAVRGIQR